MTPPSSAPGTKDDGTNGGDRSPGAKEPGPTAPPDPGGSGCAAEIEDNDGAEKATVFERCISGSLPNRGDADFLRITAPDDAATMIIEHEESGRVVYRVSEADELVLLGGDFFTEGTQTIEVNGGATYVLRLSQGNSGSGGERTWKVDVRFE